MAVSFESDNPIGTLGDVGVPDVGGKLGAVRRLARRCSKRYAPVRVSIRVSFLATSTALIANVRSGSLGKLESQSNPTVDRSLVARRDAVSGKPSAGRLRCRMPTAPFNNVPSSKVQERSDR